MSKPMYEYEVRVRQVIEGLQIVQATDAKSAREQACEDFHTDKGGDHELDVVACDLIE